MVSSFTFNFHAFSKNYQGLGGQNQKNTEKVPIFTFLTRSLTFYFFTKVSGIFSSFPKKSCTWHVISCSAQTGTVKPFLKWRKNAKKIPETRVIFCPQKWHLTKSAGASQFCNAKNDHFGHFWRQKLPNFGHSILEFYFPRNKTTHATAKKWHFFAAFYSSRTIPAQTRLNFLNARTRHQVPDVKGVIFDPFS